MRREINPTLPQCGNSRRRTQIGPDRELGQNPARSVHQIVVLDQHDLIDVLRDDIINGFIGSAA